MYDFDNNIYKRGQNGNCRAMEYAGNFQTHAISVTRKNHLADFIQITCQTIFALALFSVFFLIFANLPQIFDWLTGVIIGVFEFIFKVVEFLFSLAFTILFFFFAGIFAKW